MKRISVILLILLFLPGCTFYNGSQLRTTEELQNVSTFQYVIIGVFVGLLVLSTLVALFADGDHGAKAAGMAVVAVLVVLILCA